METQQRTVQHFTPTAAELQPFHKIKCQQPNCESTFLNMGNYELHLQKRHKILRDDDKSTKTKESYYYCPNVECIYNFKKGTNGRHFLHIKNLRQHYQKVHSKNFICEHCGRAFPTTGQLIKHADKFCGKRFKCLSCNWDFETVEALLVHGKRKGHIVKTANETKKNESLQKSKAKGKQIEQSTKIDKRTQTDIKMDIITKNSKLANIQTQTENMMDTMLISQQQQQHDNETQTENDFLITNNNSIFDDINSIHHDIGSQTELSLQHSPPITNSNSGGTFFEHILKNSTTSAGGGGGGVPGANMHTQTCDAYLLSAFGLSDIQTQTNWSSFEDHHHYQHQKNHMYTSTASTSTSTARGIACDELLVSTETQTSFTQCLLNMNCDNELNNTVGGGTNDVGGASDECTNTFANLYNTQHTQTCDLLLEGLFGGQENDLISGFQSTHTQT